MRRGGDYIGSTTAPMFCSRKYVVVFVILIVASICNLVHGQDASDTFEDAYVLDQVSTVDKII